MGLLVNLRHLEAEDLELKGEIPVAELDLEIRDELIHVDSPMSYDVCVQLLEENLLAQGRLSLNLQCECVRCLRPVNYSLKISSWALHLPLKGEEKVEIAGDFVDLTPYIREDILLELPQHPLCSADCRGLAKADTGKSKKTSDTGRGPQRPSAWAELDKLKF